VTKLSMLKKSEGQEGYDTAEPALGRRASLLSDVTVLDLTTVLAGPFGSMILADLGATVVKIERLSGDPTREVAPYYLGGDSAYFLSVNRNKLSMGVDLKSRDGRRVLERLVQGSDVVLDNLRVRQRHNLGLSYEQISVVNPRVIGCSLTGFGSDGPYRDRGAYDMVIQALSGVMSLTGEDGGPSVRSGVPVGDLVAGMYMVIGVLAALAEREASGKGQHIDIGMLDCSVSLLTYLASYYFIGGLVPSHQGRGHVSVPTYNTFVTGDSEDLVICADTQPMWVALCTVLRRGDLVDEVHFKDNPTRLAHKEELLAILRAEVSKWSLNDLYTELVTAGVPAAPINRVDQVMKDPQLLSRGMVVGVPHRNGGTYRAVGSPVKCSRSAADTFLPPPGLGEHSRVIMRRAGFSEAEIDAFIQSGSVGSV
jgi:CoA:oxalate CoA-transferase